MLRITRNTCVVRLDFGRLLTSRRVADIARRSELSRPSQYKVSFTTSK